MVLFFLVFNSILMRLTTRVTTVGFVQWVIDYRDQQHISISYSAHVMLIIVPIVWPYSYKGSITF